MELGRGLMGEALEAQTRTPARVWIPSASVKAKCFNHSCNPWGKRKTGSYLGCVVSQSSQNGKLQVQYQTQSQQIKVECDRG